MRPDTFMGTELRFSIWSSLDSFGIADRMCDTQSTEYSEKSEAQPNGLQSCLCHVGDWVSF